MAPVLPDAMTTILVVDDEPALRKIVRLLLKGEQCNIIEAGTTRDAEAALSNHTVDLMLLDIGLPGESGLDFLERMEYRLGQTLVIMSTGVDDASVAVKAMRLGARDYIVKPYSQETFLGTVGHVLEKRNRERESQAYRIALERTVKERTKEVAQAQDATVFAMAKIAQSRDDETGFHLERIRAYCLTLSHFLMDHGDPRVDPAFNLDLYRAAPLHDIGKVGIPDSILLKPDKLSPAEFELMKTHSVIGAQCLDGAAELAHSQVGSFLRMGKNVARHHHESWDGSGYPDRLVGPAIPLEARIVSLADFYDALSFPRIYRPTAFEHNRIKEMLVDLSGKKFDPELIDIFLQVEDEFLQTRLQFADENSQDEIPAS